MIPGRVHANCYYDTLNWRLDEAWEASLVRQHAYVRKEQHILQGGQFRPLLLVSQRVLHVHECQAHTHYYSAKARPRLDHAGVTAVRGMPRRGRELQVDRSGRQFGIRLRIYCSWSAPAFISERGQRLGMI